MPVCPSWLSPLGPSEQVRGQGCSPSSTSMEGGCVRMTRPAGSPAGRVPSSGCPVAGRWRASRWASSRPLRMSAHGPQPPPNPRCSPRADCRCLSQRQTWIHFPNILWGHPSGQRAPCPQTSSLEPLWGAGKEARSLRGGWSAQTSRRVSLTGDEGTVAPEVPSAVWPLGVQGTSCRVGHGVGGLLRPRLWARCHPDL